MKVRRLVIIVASVSMIFWVWAIARRMRNRIPRPFGRCGGVRSVLIAAAASRP